MNERITVDADLYNKIIRTMQEQNEIITELTKTVRVQTETIKVLADDGRKFEPLQVPNLKPGMIRVDEDGKIITLKADKIVLRNDTVKNMKKQRSVKLLQDWLYTPLSERGEMEDAKVFAENLVEYILDGRGF